MAVEYALFGGRYRGVSIDHFRAIFYSVLEYRVFIVVFFNYAIMTSHIEWCIFSNTIWVDAFPDSRVMCIFRCFFFASRWPELEILKGLSGWIIPGSLVRFNYRREPYNCRGTSHCHLWQLLCCPNGAEQDNIVDVFTSVAWRDRDNDNFSGFL